MLNFIREDLCIFSGKGNPHVPEVIDGRKVIFRWSWDYQKHKVKIEAKSECEKRWRKEDERMRAEEEAAEQAEQAKQANTTKQANTAKQANAAKQSNTQKQSKSTKPAKTTEELEKKKKEELEKKREALAKKRAKDLSNAYGAAIGKLAGAIVKGAEAAVLAGKSEGHAKYRTLLADGNKTKVKKIVFGVDGDGKFCDMANDVTHDLLATVDLYNYAIKTFCPAVVPVTVGVGICANVCGGGYPQITQTISAESLGFSP